MESFIALILQLLHDLGFRFSPTGDCYIQIPVPQALFELLDGRPILVTIPDGWAVMRMERPSKQLPPPKNVLESSPLSYIELRDNSYCIFFQSDLVFKDKYESLYKPPAPAARGEFLAGSAIQMSYDLKLVHLDPFR